MKKAEPQVPFVPYRSDDRAPHERVLDLMDMAHAKTCCILKQLGRAWPRPADEPALNAHSSTYRCLRIPRRIRSKPSRPGGLDILLPSGTIVARTLHRRQAVGHTTRKGVRPCGSLYISVPLR